ncbi:MAG: RNA polymerase sigma factor [Planctomycetota bacterium]|jgi:RNA polymerase sigma-70 factor (ECF subfamily)
MSNRREDDRRVDLRAVRLSVEELYEAHGDLVYARTMSILRDHQRAEDAVQETWLSAARALARGTVPEYPPQWLLTIARRTARRVGRRAGKPGLPLDREPKAPPERNEVEVTEERRRVHAALSSLPEEDREILTLRYLEGLPPRALRKRFGVSRSTLWERIAAARERLKRALRAQPA